MKNGEMSRNSRVFRNLRMHFTGVSSLNTAESWSNNVVIINRGVRTTLQIVKVRIKKTDRGK